jgi:multicomponent Na+:H+ antiporter subunit D
VQPAGKRRPTGENERRRRMTEPATLTLAALSALVFAPVTIALLRWAIPAAAFGEVLSIVVALLLLVAMLPVTSDTMSLGGFAVTLGGHAAPLGIEWAVDGLTLAMLWLVQAVAVSVNWYIVGWRREVSAATARLVQAIWLLLWGGLNALFLSADLFNIYVTLEVTSLAGVALVAASGGEALRAAMRYLLFALAGSLFFLLGVALVYAGSGTLALRLIEAGSLPAAAFALTLGLMIKAALFPVHGWLPPAHASAPAPASTVLSALVVPSAAYLLLRLWTGPLAGAWSPSLVQLLGLVGMAGAIYASLQALRQDRLKRIIAYSTVAQLGYLLLVPALSGLLAWQGVIYHAAAHGFAKASMFLAAGNITRAMRDDRLANLAGMDRILSGNLMVIAICGVSLAGLPPSGGFIGKWWLVAAALERGQWWWAVGVIGGGLVTAAYVFRILAAAMRRAGTSSGHPIAAALPLPASMLWPPYLLAFIALALGFTGDALAPMLTAAVPERVLP